jgi:hypothetical protein
MRIRWSQDQFDRVSLVPIARSRRGSPRFVSARFQLQPRRSR